MSSDLRPTDAELLQRFIHKRDQEAFHEIVQRHGRLVMGVCLQCLKHRQDAEERPAVTIIYRYPNIAIICSGVNHFGIPRRHIYCRHCAKVRSGDVPERAGDVQADLPEPRPSSRLLHVH